MKTLFKRIDKTLVALTLKLIFSILALITMLLGAYHSFQGDYQMATYYFVLALILGGK